MIHNRDMAHQHAIIKCSCGVILGQCRCITPNKPIVIHKEACPKCRPFRVRLESMNMEGPNNV